MTPGFGAGFVIPDLWQQEAVRALQQGKHVVVQAPTGSGKTLHLRAALSEPENSGRVHRSDPRTRARQAFKPLWQRTRLPLQKSSCERARCCFNRNNESNWYPFSFGQMIRRCRFESLKQT